MTGRTRRRRVVRQKAARTSSAPFAVTRINRHRAFSTRTRSRPAAPIEWRADGMCEGAQCQLSPAGRIRTRTSSGSNRSDRTEALNAHLFESIAELRALTDTWLRIYNSERVLFHKSADILRASRDWTISSYRAGR
jgi:hypothetical protein